MNRPRGSNITVHAEIPYSSTILAFMIIYQWAKWIDLLDPKIAFNPNLVRRDRLERLLDVLSDK